MTLEFPKYNCVVIGSGPSGAMAASILARAGRSVILLDRKIQTGTSIGESLPPAINPLLKQLNIYQQFLKSNPISCPANLSIWGDEEPFSNDFIFNPYGKGWHIDRLAFNRLVLDEAINAGADFKSEVRINAVEKRGDEFIIEYKESNQSYSINSDWLVLATGRGHHPLRFLDQRQKFDGLICNYFIKDNHACKDLRTWIEAEKDGWWYSSIIPNKKVVHCYFTDADIIPNSNRISWLNEKFSATKLIKTRLAGNLEQYRWETVDARSGLLDFTSEQQILPIGDSALSMDPLSSSGLWFALSSANQCANVILGNTSKQSYQDWITNQFNEYMSNYTKYYGQEGRWKTNLFWLRRTSTSIRL
ncbi:tryptophan 7-halogenase [Ekhidna sp.]|uniref:NAD(P)/FAD-dependent oxidoreductase n=1 Tax=Ekhidna sp. TaxID=2608089 RepID=UPI00329A4499